ncbi:MAG: hypothetical protein J6Z14_04585 [Prevotella sp.]|nr:hypothetical protein [Prevotella sp.]
MKQMKKLLVCTMLLAMLGCLNVAAQTLVFHLAGGAKSTVSLPATFTVTPSGNMLVIESDGTRVELSDGDVTCVTYRAKSGDVNGDQTVDVADISTILSLMAGYKPGEDDNPVDTGQAPANAKGIDLGLPSGTLWANMNVGATSPQENGLYFAWGETKGYTSDTSDGRLFDYASYKWMTEGQSSYLWINKYQVADNLTDGCWYQYSWDILDYEFIGDGKATLDPEDDAAAVNWGGDWQMPTIEDFNELLENTTNEWITVGSMTGRKFTSKTNGNSIFLPAAGYRKEASLVDQGTVGYYLSATLYPSGTHGVKLLSIASGQATTINVFIRTYGRSVRPVLRK